MSKNKNFKKQNAKEKGSMLFLAMVVMGIMLVLGVGIATLLVRQIRESGVSENTAIAFYIKETALDGFSVLDTWTEITWSGVEKKLEYKAIENEGEYGFAIRIDDNSYYFFEEETTSGGDDPDENIFTVHYSNPNNWEEVYLLYEEDGTYPCEVMTESGGWFDYSIDVTTLEETRFKFNESSGCGGAWDGVYPNTSIPDSYLYLEGFSEIYISGKLSD